MSGGGNGGSSNNGGGATATPATAQPGYRPEIQAFAEADPGLLAMLAQQMQQGFGGGLLDYQKDINGMYSPVNIPILANPAQYEAYAKNPLTQVAKTPPPPPTAKPPTPAAPVAKPSSSSKQSQQSIDLAAMRARQRARATSD